MSLATRCPACSTVFRVVQDQLKVSGGWVRCGQCHEVFNGLQSLFELPAEPVAQSAAPLPSSPAAPGPGLFATPPVDAVAVSPWEPTEPAGFDVLDQPRSGVDLSEDEPEADDETPTRPMETPAAWPAAASVAPAPANNFIQRQPAPDHPFWAASSQAAAPAQFTTQSTSLAAAQGTPLAASEAITELPSEVDWDENGAPAEPAPEAPLPADASFIELQDAAFIEFAPPVAAPLPGKRRKRHRKPSFMRKAERAALWRRPAMRVVLGATSLTLAALLALQVVHQQRDDVAARWPSLAGPLATWCQFAGCRLQPPRALASLVLDSSALTHTAEPHVLHFEAELRNAADHAVRAPALEVSFTDNLGQQLVRKVLLPEQMAAPEAGILPERAWHIDLPLQVGDLQVAGFTAEVFYP